MGKRGPPPTFCRICGDPCFGHGLCNKHYKRWRKNGNPLRTRKQPNGTLQQFLRKAVAHKGNGCLLWPYKGNGFIWFRGTMMRVGRAICILAHRNPQKKPEAAHRCGNRLCINPRHLYWATSKENKADMVRHGTAWWL